MVGLKECINSSMMTKSEQQIISNVHYEPWGNVYFNVKSLIWRNMNDNVKEQVIDHFVISK